MWRPIVEKVLPHSAMDELYLEDFLDVNEAMSVFGDCQDLDLRPPPDPTEMGGNRDSVQMSRADFEGMFGSLGTTQGADPE